MIDLMVGYLTEYNRHRLFAFHWSIEKFVGVSL
jgi:hypothetical protein